MLKIITFLILFVINTGVNAQIISDVNMDMIKTEVSDSTSTFYYPELVDRFLNKDTSLTSAEMKHLYYGNVFQTYYHPYGATQLQKRFFESKLPARERIELGEKVLQENPVNLRVLLDLILTCNQLKDPDLATVYAKMYVSFLEVIYASGNGKSEETAFVVISVDDEYRIADDLGLTVVGQQLNGSCDRLKFSKKGQKRRNRINHLFFNVRLPLTHLSSSFDQPDLPEAEATPDVD